MELARLLRIELKTDGVSELVVGAPQDALAMIRIDAIPCTSAAREVVVAIDDVATGKSVRRRIALDGVDAASRPRALALEVAELLRASWAELSVTNAPPSGTPVPVEVLRAVRLRNPPPSTSATPPLQSSTPSPPASTAPRLIRVTLAARVFPSYQSVVLGPAAGVSVPLGSLPLTARVAAYAGFGKAYDALGTIDLALVGGDLGLMLAGGTDSVRAEIGPLLDIGNGWATGHPIAGGSGSSASAIVVSAHLAATGAVRVGAGWWSTADLAVGGVLQSFDAQAAGRSAAGFGGPVVSVGLGIAREL